MQLIPLTGTITYGRNNIDEQFKRMQLIPLTGTITPSFSIHLNNILSMQLIPLTGTITILTELSGAICQ